MGLIGALFWLLFFRPIITTFSYITMNDVFIFSTYFQVVFHQHSHVLLRAEHGSGLYIRVLKHRLHDYKSDVLRHSFL